MVVEMEQAVCAAFDKPWYQITLPAIDVGAIKMSGATLTSVPWQNILPMIERRGPEGARAWLTRHIDYSDLPGPDRQWDWDNWASAINE